MEKTEGTNNSNHKFFYQAIEANKVNIEWLIQQFSSLNKKLDRLMLLSLTTLISLILAFVSFVLSHISLH